MIAKLIKGTCDKWMNLLLSCFLQHVSQVHTTSFYKNHLVTRKYSSYYCDVDAFVGLPRHCSSGLGRTFDQIRSDSIFLKPQNNVNLKS